MLYFSWKWNDFNVPILLINYEILKINKKFKEPINENKKNYNSYLRFSMYII